MDEQQYNLKMEICSYFTREDLKEDIRELEIIDSFGTKKELRELESILSSNERIKYLTSGFLDGNTWLIVCTNKRLLFIDKGMVYGIKQKSIPLEKITSLSHTKGLIFSKLMIQEGTNNFMIDNIGKHTIDFMIKTIEKQMELQKYNSSSNSDNVNVLDELKKAKELLDMGALSENEFRTLKEKILNNY